MIIENDKVSLQDSGLENMLDKVATHKNMEHK